MPLAARFRDGRGIPKAAKEVEQVKRNCPLHFDTKYHEWGAADELYS
jgi:hypothetical protein